jgi:sigma-B regulation protein RsbU (phosphoserine phosphatase)
MMRRGAGSIKRTLTVSPELHRSFALRSHGEYRPRPYSFPMNFATDITVRDVMTPDPIRLAPEQTIQEALDLMNRHRVGAVLVTLEDRLRGIFTERDFLRRAATASPGWRTATLAEWMSPDPYTIPPDAGWEQALTSLERLRVRHLPVVEDGRVVGIVSARQLIGRRAEYLKTVVGARTREVRQANEALLARDAEMRHSMKAAARLQRHVVLPHAPPAWAEISIGVHFAPLDPLGGDYYDFATPGDDHLGILIADASGHGIPAAMVAVMTRFAFVEAAARTTSPGEVLTALNARLQELTDERFVTAFYGVFDRRNRRLTYANAGHPFPLHYSAADKTCRPLSARGFLLGVSPEEVYRERSVELAPGDRLGFFTDGVTDTRNDLGESFSLDRFQEGLLSLPDGGNPKEWVKEIVGRLAEFRGSERAVDDVTMILAGVN